MEESTSKAYVEPSGLMASALAPAGEAGTSLFLINLCASMAPAQLTSKSLPGLEAYRLYQVTRVEDGRTRYRLRLGFFTTEAEAEEVLLRVREQYPTAFTACLSEEDRRHTRGYIIKAPASKPMMTIVPSQPVKTIAPAAATPKPTSPAPAPAAKSAVAPKAAQQTTTIAKPAPPATKAAMTPAQKAITVAPPAAKTVPAKSAKSSSLPTPATYEDLQGLENLSWEPPALDSKAAAREATGKHVAQTVAPGFKTQPVLKAEAPKGAAQSASKNASKADSSPSMRAPALELTLSDPPPPPATKSTAAPSNQPFHVGKGIDIPAVKLSLQTEPAPLASTPNKVAPSKAPSAPQKAATPPAKPAITAPPKAATPAPAKAPAIAAKPTLVKNPDLDSTQTIRALTSEELANEAQEKWFAIQLAASEQPVNLDAMPHLDIFEAYRLYSIATAGSGKIVHSLRLGFFKEAVSAEAVAGYLKTFFSSPTVLRISLAEQARFKDATMPKKPPAVETKPNVVELNSARASRASVPTVTMEVVPGSHVDSSATGSFRMNSTGSFRTSDTATHRTLTTPGMKPAAKSAAPATKRSAPVAKKTPSKSSTTGRYKIPPKKSLAEQLLEEAKEVELSESGIYKMPKNDSLLSRLVDKLKK